MYQMFTYTWGDLAGSICSVHPLDPNFFHQYQASPRMCPPKSPSFLNLPCMPLTTLILSHQPPTSSSAGFCVPSPDASRGTPWLSKPIRGASKPPTDTTVLCGPVEPGAWHVEAITFQGEMKWYIELIERWISNDRDLMSNQNTFTQHKQWLHGSGCMSQSGGPGQ